MWFIELDKIYLFQGQISRLQKCLTNISLHFTGNRWIVSIWSATPHKQPPLDFTELEGQHQHVQYVHQFHAEEYHDIHKRDTEFVPSVSQQPLTSSQEYLELHKRESDI